MKINDIYESTTAGSVATVAMPMTGGVQSRSKTGTGVYSTKKVGNLTNKKPGKYANSIRESKDKYVDLEPAITGLEKEMNQTIFQGEREANDPEYRAKMIADRKRRAERHKRETKAAEHLDEEELIIIPGQGHKLKSGFIPHAEDRRDHEVSMARSDLFQAAKNAKQTFEMLQNVSEDQGVEGWVQAKITKAADYLATVREYLEGKQVQGMAEGSVVSMNDNPATIKRLAKQWWNGNEQQYAKAQQMLNKMGWDIYEDEDDIILSKDGQEYSIPMDDLQGMAEGAKVDRMVKHIEKSERGLGKSKDKASDIAWATANKRGMLDNKNKK